MFIIAVLLYFLIVVSVLLFSRQHVLQNAMHVVVSLAFTIGVILGYIIK